MKRLTCEICGSTDLIKQDGVFVCQSCGTKYSVEEAKKMMVEGPDNVSGSAGRADTSNELANLYQLARRAKANKNSENAAKYYDMILIKDPASWEANFYSVYFKAMSCTIGQIPSAASSISNCLQSVFSLIKQTICNDASIQKAVTEVHIQASSAASLLLTASANAFLGLQTDNPASFVPDLSARSYAAADIAFTLGTAIDKMFGDKLWAQELVKSSYETGNSLLATFIKVMRPKSFLQTANIHGQQEKIANAKIEHYKNKILDSENKCKRIKEREAQRREAEQAARNKAYWDEHAAEKAALEAKISALTAELDKYSEPRARYEALIAEYEKESKASVPAEEEKNKIQDKISDLQSQLSSLGLFTGKKKEAIRAQLVEERLALNEAWRKVDAQKAELKAESNKKIHSVRVELDPILSKIKEIKASINEVEAELSKKR